MSENYLKDLFIDEAKPALDKFKGAGSSGESEQLKGLIEGTLTEFETDAFVNIRSRCFNAMHTLTNVKSNSVTTVGSYAFDGCKNLVNVELPNVEGTLGDFAFASCISLTSIKFDLVKALGSNSFNGCTALRVADFGNVNTIWTTVFRSSPIDTLILRNKTVATLKNVSAFDLTPFASGGTGGTVYVPQALIESYQTATNWSTLYAAGTCNFAPIEGSEYE